MVQLVVLAHAPVRHLLRPFADGSLPWTHLTERIERLALRLGSHTSVLWVHREDVSVPDPPANWEPASIPVSASAGQVLAKLAQVRAPETETLVVCTLDAPLCDLGLAAFLTELHRQSWCDYTFADGFPEGFAPEIVRAATLEPLAALATAGSLAWTRTLFFDALSRDMNAFDIETEAAPTDYALFRLSLTVGLAGNHLLCDRIRSLADEDLAREVSHPVTPQPYRAGYDETDSAVLRSLREDVVSHRTLPYWYQIQVTEALSQRPSYLPWSQAAWAGGGADGTAVIELSDWETLLDRIWSITPEASIAIGYRGEPALYPQIGRLVQAVGERAGLKLYVETSGVGWRAEDLTALSAPHVAAVIVALDSIDPDLYRELRGAGMEEALGFVEHLREAMPGRVYVEAVRMDRTEEDVVTFYRHWNGVDGVAPIIQKYNSFAGRLADRRVADLSPLQRHPCRHLQREMVILADGRVVRCHQDLDGDEVRGNLLSDDFAHVWAASDREWRAHVEGKLPAMCAACDEYYTFNG